MTSPQVSLIIPAYNEAARLPDTLRTVLAYLDAQALSAELIVVDDGSQDATPQLIQDAAHKDPRVVAALSPQNRGKGAAVRAGGGASSERGEVTVDDAALDSHTVSFEDLFCLVFVQLHMFSSNRGKQPVQATERRPNSQRNRDSRQPALRCGRIS